MSQRRGGNGTKESAIQKEEEMMPFSEALDHQPNASMDRDPTGPPSSGNGTSTSLDSRYEDESREMRIKQWQEGPFATGLTDASWEEEYHKMKQNPNRCCDMSEDGGAPCGCCSAFFCPMFRAGRVGNMAVLKESQEWVEETQIDEGGATKTTRFTRPRLDVVVGPYWPMLVTVTYPLIFGVSIATLLFAIPGKPLPLIAFWTVCTVGLIYALAMTACRDPGILPRYKQPPPQDEESWRWSDRAHSYRPRGAFYDVDTAVIVEGFDHTCPWTGTAIGKKNMRAFQFFVGLVFLCLMMDIVLLTGGIP